MIQNVVVMKKKISGKRNRVKWLVKGILYVSIVPWKVLIAILAGLGVLIWITISVLIVIILSIIWLGLSPIELAIFLSTGLTGFILWPKIAMSWWIDLVLDMDIESIIEKLFTLIERNIQKES